MSKVFILARERLEASEIAQLAGLDRPEWSWLTDTSLRGRRGGVVLATGYHCWSTYEGLRKAQALNLAAVIIGCKTIVVPCPPDWEGLGYQLPKGWDES